MKGLKENSREVNNSKCTVFEVRNYEIIKTSLEKMKMKSVQLD